MSSAETIGKGLALAGFLFTVVTYAHNLYNDRQTERYKKSIELIELYESSGIRQREIELLQRLLYYDGSDLNDPKKYSDEEFDLVAKETLFGFDGEVSAPKSKIKPFLNSMLDIVDFYARVNFCIESQTCNFDIARRYFCPRAVEFDQRNQRLMNYWGTYANVSDWNGGLKSFGKACS